MTTLLLIVSLLANAFGVLSRSALAAFSLADAEELLRRQQRVDLLLPALERVAAKAERFQALFLLLINAAKALMLLALWHSLTSNAPEHALWLVVLIYPLLLLLSDTLMRPVGAAYPEHLVLKLHRSWSWLGALCWLPAAPFVGITRLLERVLNRGRPPRAHQQGEDDILAVVSLSEATGRISAEQRDMIESVLALRDHSAEAVMTPRTDMVALPEDADFADVLRVVRESGHSRLPVYRETRDQIVGILHVKDLIQAEGEQRSLRRFLRKPLFVPASKPVAEVLVDLRRERVHLAVVLDEYGGTAGVLSLEDIIEEVFGEIEDEYDEIGEPETTRIAGGALELDARLHVDEINERFQLNLPESERYESLGGLLCALLGRIPAVGSQWTSEDGSHVLTVLEASDRRVDRVRLERRVVAEDAA